MDERWYMWSLWYWMLWTVWKTSFYQTGGGVGLFIAQHLEFMKRNDLCNFDDCIECISTEIERTVFCINKNVIITVIYRPPDTDPILFNEKLGVLLECVLAMKRSYGTRSVTMIWIFPIMTVIVQLRALLISFTPTHSYRWLIVPPGSLKTLLRA